MKETDVYGLYKESWTGEIVEDAFSHPAKFSRALIRFIYRHAIEQGYIRPGDTIVDCFAGVGLGALDAMRYGLHWRGVELEARFCTLGQQNIDLWNARYAAAFPGWGTAQLLQGDSRQLASVLQEAAACVASPPFSDCNVNIGAVGDTPGMRQQIHNSKKRDNSYGGSPGQLGAMPEGDVGAVVSSPPFAQSVNTKPDAEKYEKWAKNPDGSNRLARSITGGGYGTSPGQLGSMPEGAPADAIVSSPPYADSVDGTGEGPGARYDYTFHAADNARKASSANGYGRSDGNLGAMVEGDADACVSSPPFMDGHAGHDTDGSYFKQIGGVRHQGLSYGETMGNIGNDTGSTFWEAAKAIVEQVHAVLRPGGYAIWITGDFVRNGQRVHFGQQWLQLCQACGFEPVEWIRCWKREPGPTQLGLLGDDHDHTIDRVSFFRRLSNKRNPEAAILNEDVIICRKQ